MDTSSQNCFQICVCRMETQLSVCLSHFVGKTCFFACSDASQSSVDKHCQKQSVRNLPLERRMTKRIKSLLALPVVSCSASHLNAIEDYSCSLESTESCCVSKLKTV